MTDECKGLNLAELIDLLEPVPDPAPISMMPQTAGWLWLGAILLVFIGVGYWKFLLWRRKTAYRREALAELATCPNDPQRLAELLRRTALSAYVRQDVAALHGPDWLTFLDHAYGGTGFSDGPGKAVAEAPYKKTGDGADLKPLIRTWIKTHKSAAA
ncbi:DUF4381 domain-containing protein [Labrenzia sp. PHM005]|uniref:DUF4381 domain-containing protein n=1 Tax=Labrenzia sp. PHM005 TaxID=2590016 RepID=UPI001140238C|nr:DUF4381 domain-containing protein [Labrenzia sp. PHM005]QDG78737.1 DUF4381 domain-containing protein [Labrenzia sp. PHM005]